MASWERLPGTAICVSLGQKSWGHIWVQTLLLILNHGILSQAPKSETLETWKLANRHRFQILEKRFCLFRSFWGLLEKTHRTNGDCHNRQTGNHHQQVEGNESGWLFVDKFYGQLLLDDASGLLFMDPHFFYISSLPFLWIVVGKILSVWWFQSSYIFIFIYGNFIIPTDELIFFRGVGSTTNQLCILHRKSNPRDDHQPVREKSPLNVAKLYHGFSHNHCLRNKSPQKKFPL